MQHPEKEALPDNGKRLLSSVLIGTAPPEIVELEAQIRAAQLKGDVAALDRLISAELLFTGHDGQLGSKAEDLEAHGSGFFRFHRHHPEELRVLSVGPDVAVSNLKSHLAVEVGGRMVEGTFRYTRVWATVAEGSWRVVAGHVSQILAPDKNSADS